MKKRVLSFALVCVMAFSMTACAGKEKIGGNRVTISTADLKTSMWEELSKIDSVNIKLNGDLSIKGEVNASKAGIELGNSGKYIFDFDSEALINVKEPGAYINYKLDISSKNKKVFGDLQLDDANYEGECYVDVEDDIIDYYFNIGKGWYKDSAKTDEIKNLAIQEIAEYMDLDQFLIFLTDDVDVELEYLPVLSNKTVDLDGRECYELSTVHGKEAIGGMPEFKMYYDMIQEFGYKICLYVDTETKLPVKMVYDIDIVMKDDSNGQEELIDFEDFTFEMTMVYNETDPIVVPDDVKNASYEYSGTK